MKQSHRATLIEALSGTAFGFAVAVAANLFVLPRWGFSVSLRDSTEIGIIFTLISIARSYIWRRLFEILRIKGILP